MVATGFNMLAVLLVTMRLTGLAASAQVLGANMVPWRVRLALVIAVAIVLQPVVPAPRVGSSALEIVAASVVELLVGLAVGFTASIFFHGVRTAGQLAGIQMGLGFSALVDPTFGEQTTVMARWLGLAAWMVVIGFDGHHVLLRGLAESFAWVPAGGAGTALGRAVMAIPAAGAQLFVTAVVVAAPAVMIVLLLNVGMALLARAAPQLHILVIGFIFTITIGICTVAFSLTGMAGVFRDGYLRMAQYALSFCRPV
ncbi:MAG: flagellar biosynthetic protein FliR [Deltaproteobacteria bacterium]|nr:MAG: flagellar biosynthetic protein FliR [Deltaproteobacteria bacterium]